MGSEEHKWPMTAPLGDCRKARLLGKCLENLLDMTSALTPDKCVLSVRIRVRGSEVREVCLILF